MDFRTYIQEKDQMYGKKHLNEGKGILKVPEKTKKEMEEFLIRTFVIQNKQTILGDIKLERESEAAGYPMSSLMKKQITGWEFLINKTTNLKRKDYYTKTFKTPDPDILLKLQIFYGKRHRKTDAAGNTSSTITRTVNVAAVPAPASHQ